MARELTRDDRLQLGKIATQDEDGRHFTAIYPAEWLDEMESEGYLTINRPTHEATAIP